MNHRILLLLLSSFLACAVAHAGVLVGYGPWVGAVTPNSATVVAVLKQKDYGTHIQYATMPDFSDAVMVPHEPLPKDAVRRVLRFQLKDLQPATRYYYRVVHEENSPLKIYPDETDGGEFKTFPKPGPTSFFFAVSSCGSTGSINQVYTAIKYHAPAFYMNIGDLHYEDINQPVPDLYRSAYQRVLASATQGDLYRHIPFVYVWDDHDFGGNDSDGRGAFRPVAQQVYREYVPHYPLAAGEGDKPVTQTFSYGRVHFVVLDLRSDRSPPAAPDDANKTMMGEWQKNWFKQHMAEAAKKYPLIFVVSAGSWISQDKNKDNWGAYQVERREIANYLKGLNLQGRICILSGDAHMLGADTGVNGDYADGGGMRIPVFQAGSLDRKGSIKGGPWTTVTPVKPEIGEGQWGQVEIQDRGSKIHVIYRGLNDRGEEKLRSGFTVDVPEGL